MSVPFAGPPAEPDFPCVVGCIACGHQYHADGEDDPCPECDEDEREATAWRRLAEAIDRDRARNSEPSLKSDG